MALITSHFSERFAERNPNGNFSHFYACMKRNELTLIKTVLADNGKRDEVFEYNCPITKIEYVAVKRVGDSRGDIWVTFMYKELFIQRQLAYLSYGRQNPLRSRNPKFNKKKDHKRRRYTE